MRLGLFGRRCAIVWPVALAVLAVASCAKSTRKADATLAVTPLKVDLGYGRIITNEPLIGLMYPELQLTDPEVVPSPLVFGKHRDDEHGINKPIILRDYSGQWSYVTLGTFDETEWVYAGACIERNELWAILDSASVKRGPGLYLMRSTDGGLTWTLFSALKPPALSVEFVSFTMDADGHARITEHQDDDTDLVQRGLYRYESADDGKTWTGPDFSADDLVSADPPAYPLLPDTLSDIDPKSAIPASETDQPIYSRGMRGVQPFGRNFPGPGNGRGRGG
jgi:hypothetical protein